MKLLTVPTPVGERPVAEYPWQRTDKVAVAYRVAEIYGGETEVCLTRPLHPRKRAVVRVLTGETCIVLHGVFCGRAGAEKRVHALCMRYGTTNVQWTPANGVVIVRLP